MALDTTILATRPRNLRHYWLLNDHASIADSGLGTRSLTTVGTLSTVAGQVGNAVQFPGTSGNYARYDVMTSENPPMFHPFDDFPDSEWTVHSLVKAPSSGSQKCFINFGNQEQSSDAGKGVFLGTQSGAGNFDRVRVSRYNGNMSSGKSPAYALGSNTVIADNTWKSLAVRRRRLLTGDILLEVLLNNAHVDGSPLTISEVTFRTFNDDQNDAGNRSGYYERFGLGCTYDRGSFGTMIPGTYTNCALQHLAVWNVALSDAQLTALFAETGL